MTRGLSCIPYGIRTRAATLRGWSPRPLDERDLMLSALPPIFWEVALRDTTIAAGHQRSHPAPHPANGAGKRRTPTRDCSRLGVEWLGREDLNPQRQYQKLLCYQLHHAPSASRSGPRRNRHGRCECRAYRRSGRAPTHVRRASPAPGFTALDQSVTSLSHPNPVTRPIATPPASHT